MKVIVVIQPDDRTTPPLNVIEGLLVVGDELRVVEERLVDVRLIEKRPASRS